MDSLSGLCRLLGDTARLRILRLLSKERLNVGELTGILGLAQSGVSRHLGLLRDAGLVEEAREAGFTWFRASGRDRAPDVWGLLDQRFGATADAVTAADDARLLEVLRVRKERFSEDRASRSVMPGRSWAAWARALGHLLPGLEIADLGCGEGYLALEAARFAKRVVAVDRSTEAIREARDMARRRGVRNVEWKRGDIERLPLPDSMLDVALLSQSLHHAEDPARALTEAARVVRPGGRVLVMDLRRHDQAWTRERLGDRWPGFEDEALSRLLTGAGLENVKVEVGASLRGDPFTVLVASGRKPARRRRERTRA